MVHHDVLREAQGPQAVERFAFRPSFAVKVIMRGLTARPRQEPQRRRSRIGCGGIEVVEADVEAREERMILELGRCEVVVRERADVEKQNVERRVLLRNSRREFRAALLFVGEERLVPFLHGLAVRYRLVLSGSRAPVDRGNNRFILLGVARKKCVHHRRHRHADEAAERDEGDADRVPEKHVENDAERAPADHLPVDEVECEFEDVVPREPGNAARIRRNALNPGEPAFAPEKEEGADDARRAAQEPQDAGSERNEKHGNEERIPEGRKIEISRPGESELREEVEIPDAQSRNGQNQSVGSRRASARGRGLRVDRFFRSHFYFSASSIRITRRPSRSKRNRPSSNPSP